MKIAIIGGGITGLTCAYELSKQGIDISLFEKEEKLGGLSTYIKINNSYIDKYYHFICGEDKAYINFIKELKLENYLKGRITKMGYFHNNKIYSFSNSIDILRFNPLSFYNRLNYGLSILKMNKNKNIEELDKINATTYLKNISNDEIFNTIWEVMLKNKFGNYYNEISAAWINARIRRVASSRLPLLFIEYQRYIKSSTKTLIDKLENEIIKNNGKIYKNIKVDNIKLEQEQTFTILQFDNCEIIKSFDKVISTVPVPIFLKLVNNLPTHYKEKLEKIKYIGVVCFLFILNKKLTDYFFLNVNDKELPFVLVVEYTNLDKREDLNKSIVYIPHYLPQDHPYFYENETKLLDEYINYLSKINKNFEKMWIDKFYVIRDEFAQPICSVNFLELIPQFTTPIKNLYMLDQTQLYPNDRTIAGSIELAKKLCKLIIQRKI